MIIAIDGPAASGKGTLGKRLAAHYGFRHLDTGVIYRAVAKALLDAGADLTDEARAVAAALELDPEKFGIRRSDRSRSASRPRWSLQFPGCARRCRISSANSQPNRPARCSTAATSGP